jgi:hypothetical protein
MTTPTDPDELRAEIARTRVELGETAAALAAKTDLTSRVKHSLAGLPSRALIRVGTIFRRKPADPAIDRKRDM